MTRAAIAGTGYAARVHAWALQALGVEVAAVCGRTQAGAEACAAELGGNAYDDLAELLERERVDCLHVCTPNASHCGQALAALESGVPVVCEKPLAVSTEESARLLEAVRDLTVMTCYHVRGYPLVEHARAEVAAGAIGEVTAVHGRYLCDDLVLPGAAEGWRVDPARSGPSYVVADLGTHWLDAAEHVAGVRVAEVLADFRGEPLEHSAVLLLRFENGATGSVVLSAAAAGRKNQLQLEVEGSRGGFSWDQETPDVLLERVAGEPTRLVVKDPAANAASARPYARYPAGHGEGYGDAFRNLLREAYSAIEGLPHAPFPTFEAGHRGVALVEAAVESAHAGSWVAVGR